MRKTLVWVAVLASVAAACGSTTTTSSPAASGSAAQTTEQCAAGATLVTDGTLTVGTDSPAYPPYFQGGTEKGSEWELNDPNTGKGFESAVAYEIANRMGFSA
jgi:polar amino acid transport system substrate-binding protein